MAALLTQTSGEYVLRVGQRPPLTELYAGGLSDDTTGWIGTSRTSEEIEMLITQVTKAVEEVGGKVCLSLHVELVCN